MKNKTLVFLILVFLLLLFIDSSFAQCPMCKASAEASLKEGSSAAKGLNKGVLYMLVAPYLLVGSIGFLWWKNNKRTKQEEVS